MPSTAEYCRIYREANREDLTNKRLIKRYGITLTQFRVMGEEQGGVCRICERPQVGVPGRALAVDHNHHTGQVRELLCDNCNLAIGKLKDDPALADRVSEYLRSWA